jgi:hypothetical protein
MAGMGHIADQWPVAGSSYSTYRVYLSRGIQDSSLDSLVTTPPSPLQQNLAPDYSFTPCILSLYFRHRPRFSQTLFLSADSSLNYSAFSFHSPDSSFNYQEFFPDSSFYSQEFFPDSSFHSLDSLQYQDFFPCRLILQLPRLLLPLLRLPPTQLLLPLPRLLLQLPRILHPLLELFFHLQDLFSDSS